MDNTENKLTGFALMSKATRKAYGRIGGLKSAMLGLGNRFTPETAAVAGKLGGEAVSKDRGHMIAIGRKGAAVTNSKNKTVN